MANSWPIRSSRLRPLSISLRRSQPERAVAAAAAAAAAGAAAAARFFLFS